MKNIVLFLLLLSSVGYAQIGVGTSKPNRGAILDLTSSKKGLLLPRVENTAAVTLPANGMMVYDKSSKCIKIFRNGVWSGCLAGGSLDVSCTGFTGNYCMDLLMGTRYVVKIINNSTASRLITPTTTDVTLSGISGVSVASVSPNVATTIAPGDSQEITYTISGTPATTGILTGVFKNQELSCSATILVDGKSTMTIGVASSSPTLCINTALSPVITHATTGVTAVGTPSGLPNGVTAALDSGTLTISGTPTQSGTFTYSIPLTGVGCGVNATGTITVTAASKTIATNPTVCINTPLSPAITETFTGATAVGTVTGLPDGVTANLNSGMLTISGTPSQSGVFDYTISIQGSTDCFTEAKGRITVTSTSMTVGAASASPTLCVNTALSPTITHTTTAVTAIGMPTGLPNGVSAAWSSNTITLSGTPIQTGTFTYTIPLIGTGCPISATGTIVVNPKIIVTAASLSAPFCINTPLSPAITHTTTNATDIGIPTGLPAGITADWNNNTITISGTPTQSGTFTYSIPLTGSVCGGGNATGTIIVTPNLVLSKEPINHALLNFALPPVKIPVINATSMGTPTGLPPGITAALTGNIVILSGTPTTEGSFSYEIPITGCVALEQVKGTIKVGKCAVKVATDAYRLFACHNLGANTSLDPHVPVIGLHGGYIQWGKLGPANWFGAASDGPAGFGAAPATDPSTTLVALWNQVSEVNANSWLNLDGTKGPKDPCPAGFRMPSRADWHGVYVAGNNTKVSIGTWTTSSPYVSAISYKVIGASSVTLTLPASGNRYSGNGYISDGGSGGYYWANRLGQYFNFKSSSGNPIDDFGYSTYGLSVRCVAE